MTNAGQLLRVKVGNSEGESLWLEYSIRNHPAAQRWAECVSHAIRVSQIHKPDQWYNFPNHRHSDANWIANKIAYCAEQLNNFHNGLIAPRASQESPQEYVNRMHVFFAEAHLKPSDSCEEETDLWEELNRWLHAYEFSLRSQETHKSAGIPEANFLVTWKNPCHRPLEPEDYEHFTVAKKFGTCYVNYCQVGRHLYEMFLSQDELAENEHILPLRRMSADSYFWFGSTTGPKSLLKKNEAIKEWFLSHEEKFNALGLHWGDPSLAIGWLPVADLHPEVKAHEEQLKFLETLSRMNRVLELEISAKTAGQPNN